MRVSQISDSLKNTGIRKTAGYLAAVGGVLLVTPFLSPFRKVFTFCNFTFRFRFINSTVDHHNLIAQDFIHGSVIPIRTRLCAKPTGFNHTREEQVELKNNECK